MEASEAPSGSGLAHAGAGIRVLSRAQAKSAWRGATRNRFWGNPHRRQTLGSQLNLYIFQGLSLSTEGKTDPALHCGTSPYILSKHTNSQRHPPLFVLLSLYLEQHKIISPSLSIYVYTRLCITVAHSTIQDAFFRGLLAKTCLSAG